jgi:hypothetical protein
MPPIGEHLTGREVERLAEAAKENRWGHRDFNHDPAGESGIDTLLIGLPTPRKRHQSRPYTPIMGPSGRKLLFLPSTGE